jgi:16S rRNA (guanine527-N7)-methyltransferase
LSAPSEDRPTDPFAGFDLESAIRSRAADCAIELGTDAVAILALHAREVLLANREPKLTAIVEPGDFVERHIGESLEGAAMIERGAAGPLLDLGSGNGYPGIPIATAHPALQPVLVEASTRKAAFLRAVLEKALARGEVQEKQVQRAGDLTPGPPIRALVTRAMGNWERVLPRLHSSLAPGADILLWAGDRVEQVARRDAWQRFRLADRRPIPNRERSWIWRFRPTS